MKISPCKYANHSKNLSAKTLNSYISSRRSAMKRQDETPTPQLGNY